jgi:hypothetical protein
MQAGDSSKERERLLLKACVHSTGGKEGEESTTAEQHASEHIYK